MWENTDQTGRLALARHSAAIHDDVVADAEQHQERFAGGVRIGGRDARHDGGECGVVAATQDVDEKRIEQVGRRLPTSRSQLSSAISIDSSG